MKLMMPFVPHLSNECLELHKCKDISSWPKLDKRNIIEEINFAIQINGKTRDIIKIKKDLDQDKVHQIIQKDSKATKYLENKKTTKIIFVKNKIINYIVS